MQQVVTKSGPLVWRDYDQEALDNAYDQLVYAPNRDLILRRMAAASDRTRENLGAPERIAYGPSEYERFDLFRAKNSPAGGAPINVFVTAERGGWAAPRITRYSPSRWCMPARMLSSSIFHQRRPGRRQHRADVPTGERRAGVDMEERGAFRCRPQEVLRVGGVFSRRASGRLRAVAVGAKKTAGRFLQGRAADQRHVRSSTGAAVEALGLREVHPTRSSAI